MMAEKVITMGVNLFVTLWLARKLGPETFGSLSYVLAVVAIVTPLSALGLNALITREVVKHGPATEHKVVVTATTLRVIGAALGALLCILYAIFWQHPKSEMLALTVISVGALGMAFNGIEYWFQAHSKAKWMVQARLTIVLVAALAKCIAVYFSTSLLLVASIFAAEFALIGVGFIVQYTRKRFCTQPTSIDWSYGKQLIGQSKWLLLSSLAAVIYLKIDQVMLANLVSRQEVGFYAVAVRLSEVWYFFAEAIVVSFFPMLLRLKGENIQEYRKRLQQLSDALLFIAVVLAVVVGFIATPVINLLFGSDYLPAANLLTIHIWAACFVFMRAVASKWLIAEDLLPYSLVSHGIGMVINVGLNLWLIPIYGGVGAALATVISYAGAGFIGFFIFTSTRPIAWVMLRSIFVFPTLGRRYWHSQKE
ncbi:flippase [Idiomarina seosinensis]|uniref:flippase n=1 Tax=Idiomarina seosinensis TaxID=281739 RepID=UPI00384F6D0D